MARMIPYAYRPGATIMHRLPALVKLPALFGMSAVFFFSNPLIAAGATCFLIALSFLAGIKPWELLRGSASLMIMLLFVLFFRSVQFVPPAINRQGFFEALLFCWCIVLSFSAAALLFSVTTMTEIKDSIGALETIVFKRPHLSLGISLMLGFLPRFFEVWETANIAWKARGGKPGIGALTVIIPLVTERMIETACETAEALEARATS